MLNGLLKLTWIETKVFLREPMGAVGTLGVPVILFIVLGRTMGFPGVGPMPAEGAPFNVHILATLVIAVNAVLSLVAIMAIYREGGILKRLRATPLSPVTILTAHVLVKLVFALLTLGLLMLAGRRLAPGAVDVPLASFAAALLLSTLSILSLGFIIASLVPTARFAQPIGAGLLYPMVALSGLFFPIAELPRWLRMGSYALPTTHAVELMQGIWNGAGWNGHWVNAGALVLIFAVCTALASRFFRWE